MLAHVLRFLRCPHCGTDLDESGGVVRCRTTHTFDVARQGYVNLLPGHSGPGTADDPTMVEARGRFLRAGHFDPLAQLLADAAEATAAAPVDCVIDVGAGTGFHLARVLDRFPEAPGLALDLSKFALRQAARAHHRIGAAACDVWGELPVRSQAAALVLNTFAPRNGPEMHRLVRSGGTLLVVTPTSRHLGELVDALGLVSVDEDKQERLATTLGPRLALTEQTDLEFRMLLDHAEVADLVGMGPSARHTDPDVVRERLLRGEDRVEVTASVVLSAFRRA